MEIKKSRGPSLMSKNITQSVRSTSPSLRISPRKLSLVAGLIRGKKVGDALKELLFSRKAIASEVSLCLKSAIANAENNYNLDIDSLVVHSATVGKSLLMKRHRARAKGRSSRINKFFSRLYIVLNQEVVK